MERMSRQTGNIRANSFLWSLGQGRVLLRRPRLPHGTLWPPPPWSATSLLHLNTLHQGGVPANKGQGLWITWTWELCPETRHKSLLHLKRFSGFLKTVWKPWRAVASDISKHWNPLRTLLLVQAPTSGLGWPWSAFQQLPLWLRGWGSWIALGGPCLCQLHEELWLVVWSISFQPCGQKPFAVGHCRFLPLPLPLCSGQPRRTLTFHPGRHLIVPLSPHEGAPSNWVDLRNG